MVKFFNFPEKLPEARMRQAGELSRDLLGSWGRAEHQNTCPSCTIIGTLQFLTIINAIYF
jgi:hypothetical protein